MSPQALHIALLRPAVLTILRASGFQSARPSVVDALTDMAARYLMLLASTTATHAFINHNTPEPTVTDVRMALEDCGLFGSSLAASEEAWKEALRKPLEEYPLRNRLRENEAKRRDDEDTRDIQGFWEWLQGDMNREIRRIAGMKEPGAPPAEGEEPAGKDDYFTILKTKHSKTGEESRYQGTILGKLADDRPVRIEGGGPETIEEWVQQTRERSAEAAALQPDPMEEDQVDVAPTAETMDMVVDTV